MSDVSINYKGIPIATMDSSGTKTLLTNGKYCEDDIEVEYVSPGSGQEMVLLASGTYTKTDFATDPSHLDIPVSFAGTPAQVFVYAPTPVEAAQSYKWAKQFDLQPELEQNLGVSLCIVIYKSASGNPSAAQASIIFQSNNTILRCLQRDSNYHVQDNTYNWYIWGYEA